jgi:serine/threonine-protein kinase
VTARLVDGEGFTLWSDVLEARVEDLLDVQRTIAGQISTALAPELGLSVTAAAPIDSSRAPDPGAYQQYLRGKFYLARRGLSSLTRAIGHFQAAIGRDSSYADAHAGLAAAFAVLPIYGGNGSDTLFQRALESATRAIALDSSLADAYAARAQAELGLWQWSRAEADLRRAIALRPEDATSHQWYGELQLLRGRINDAVRELTTAQSLDPTSPVIAGSLTHALGIAGRADEAMARGRTAVSLDSSFYLPHLMLGAAYLYTGRPKDAVTVLEIARRLEGGTGSLIRGLLGHGYARIGGEDRARQIAAELARSDDLRRQGSALAQVYLGLGDTATALDWLERAAERRDPFFTTESLASPLFDPLRSNPRFAALVRRIGLDAATLSAPIVRTGG